VWIHHLILSLSGEVHRADLFLCIKTGSRNDLKEMSTTIHEMTTYEIDGTCHIETSVMIMELNNEALM
jgi:hypothetical protein